MTGMIRSITTPAGVISGRDGIYIDRITHKIRGQFLSVEGTINGALCSDNKTGKDWLNFVLIFNRPVAYECQDIDQCDWQTEITSSFYIQTDGFTGSFRPYSTNFNLYYLSAYDQMLKIIATDFKIEITD